MSPCLDTSCLASSQARERRVHSRERTQIYPERPQMWLRRPPVKVAEKNGAESWLRFRRRGVEEPAAKGMEASAGAKTWVEEARLWLLRLSGGAAVRCKQNWPSKRSLHRRDARNRRPGGAAAPNSRVYFTPGSVCDSACGPRALDSVFRGRRRRIHSRARTSYLSWFKKCMYLETRLATASSTSALPSVFLLTISPSYDDVTLKTWP